MSRYNGKRKPRARSLWITHRPVTHVDPVTGEPYETAMYRVGPSYRDPVMNAYRKMPRKSRGKVKKLIREKRKLEGLA